MVFISIAIIIGVIGISLAIACMVATFLSFKDLKEGDNDDIFRDRNKD